MKAIPYGRQSIDRADVDAVVEALQSDLLTQGPVIEKFEEAFAEYTGSRFAVAVANGTAALHLSALALGLESGKKVISTPITFAASANCVRYCGANPVFVDIDPDTYLIDLNQVESTLKKAKKGEISGVIPVDFAGLPVNLVELRNLVQKYGIWILEDASHAPGATAEYKGKRWKVGDGNFSNLTTFSFHPVKHIAAGEGGMITTNDEHLAERLRLLRSHGITRSPSRLQENHGGWYYEMQELGFNYRLTEIQAALGLSQLRKADEGLKRRKKIAEKYDEFCNLLGLKHQLKPARFENAYHLYVIETDSRKQIYEKLRKKNIFAQVHYIPVHLQPYYRQLGWKKGDFPNAEKYYDRCLSIPIYPTLSDQELKYVQDSIEEALLES